MRRQAGAPPSKESTVRNALPIALVAMILGATLFLVACGNTSDSERSESWQASEQSAESASAAQDESAQTVETAGKQWVLLGDSLTDKTSKAETAYYDYAAADLECTIVNYGRCGTGYKAHGGDEPFFERVAFMEVADADCLTIFGSFNDLGKGFPLGTADDNTTDTVGGCMNLTIQALLGKNPNLTMGIATPTPWRTKDSYAADDPDADSALTKEECDEYVALLKEVAAKYELPVLDLYENSGLEPNDADARARYYTENGETENSGVHPSSEGHKLMYPQWRDFVTELLSRA